MKRSGSAALCLAFVALLLLSARAWADGAVVVLGGYQLNPRTVAVAVGEEVTFQVQHDEDAAEPHTVSVRDVGFRSPPLEAGDTWTVSFPEAGVYRYGLEERPSVEGTIVVR